MNKTRIILELSEELTEEELASFKEQAKLAGRTLDEHFRAIFLTPNLKDAA